MNVVATIQKMKRKRSKYERLYKITRGKTVAYVNDSSEGVESSDDDFKQELLELADKWEQAGSPLALNANAFAGLAKFIGERLPDVEIEALPAMQPDGPDALY